MNTLKILTPRAIDELSSKAGLKEKRVSNIEANQISEFLSSNSTSIDNKTVNFDTREKKKKKKKKSEPEVENQAEQALPKVIPLNKKIYEAHEAIEQKKVAVGENYYQNTETPDSSRGLLESIGVMSHDKIQKMQEEKQRVELNKQPTSTIFLLAERNRLKNLNNRLHGQRAIESYKSSIVLDIKADEKHEEEGKSNLTSGVLLDKKQF